MRWLLLTSECKSISKQCGDLLELAEQKVIYYCHQGKSSLQEIRQQISSEKPDRILVVIDDKSTSPLVRSLGDHLLIPMYVAQATTDSYSPVPVLIITCTTDNPDLNLIQNAADQLINIYPNIVNARIIAPIDDEEIRVDYFQSLWKENPDKVHRLTILSEILPILLALIHDSKASGRVDVCNKGTVSLTSLTRKDLPQSNAPPMIDREDLTEKFEKWTKQLISPETRQLYQAPFLLPNVHKSIEQIMQQQTIQIDPTAPKILLVTGGCGFIGSTFINHWLETHPNDQIVNIDRLDPVANTKNILHPTSPNYSFILADISNKDIVLHLFHQYHITHIVHFAVQAHIDTSFGNSITFTETNVYGTHSVLEASRIYGKIQKFIHISTDEVYGETPPGSNQEFCLLNPLNPYAATIAAAEFLVKSYGESFKLPYCIIRLCNVYGPRQHFEKLIPTFIHSLLQDDKLKIHGDGKQIRHYVYVDDVIKAVELILHKGKTKLIYNISTSTELSVLDIAQRLLEKLQPSKRLEEIIQHVKARSFTEKRYCTTTSSLIKSIGWHEQVTFDEGLEKTIEWFRSHPDYWTS